MRDLLVAGGGPIGLATALFAARAGLSVAVLEPRRGAIDKACGEGLMPGAVESLTDLGIPLAGHPIRGIRYTDGRCSAQAVFRAGPGYGVRRTALHASLTSAVHDAGIPLVTRSVDDVVQDAHGVAAAGCRARYLAAADGLHSPVRRQFGLDVRREPVSHRSPLGGKLPLRFGLRQHYATAPWSEFVEVHWGGDLEAYVTPVSPNLVGVALLTRRRASYATQIKAFPTLVDRLPEDAVTSPRGAGPLLQRSSARVCGRVLLVGDAAGYVDALTGEGISVGLASARALVECLVADDPAAYERRWLQVSRRYRWITWSLLRARSSRRTAGWIVPAAARLPRVFTSAVNELAR